MDSAGGCLYQMQVFLDQERNRIDLFRVVLLAVRILRTNSNCRFRRVVVAVHWWRYRVTGPPREEVFSRFSFFVHLGAEEFAIEILDGLNGAQASVIDGYRWYLVVAANLVNDVRPISGINLTKKPAFKFLRER